LLPFFALLCGWYKPRKLLLPFQPEEHPPKLSMIPLLVTLTAVTRVARRFSSTEVVYPLFLLFPLLS